MHNTYNTFVISCSRTVKFSQRGALFVRTRKVHVNEPLTHTHTSDVLSIQHTAEAEKTQTKSRQKKRDEKKHRSAKVS